MTSFLIDKRYPEDEVFDPEDNPMDEGELGYR